MLSLFQYKGFHRKKRPPAADSRISSAELLLPQPASFLLATPRRQKLLDHIWERTSLWRAQFSLFYLAPLERYAELVQQFPASESHHHAYPGGMLDHGLEIVAYALKLRQSHLLPVGMKPEEQAAQAEVWTAGTAYAALLHDIGKIAVDLYVEYADGSPWHPWHGALQQPYRFRYCENREYRLHSAATGLLYNQLLDRAILDWLSQHSDLWTALLYVLAGQYEHAGILGELVIRADQTSVAQDLGGDPGKAIIAPRHTLQRKLLDGLRYLLKEEFKINQPQASDGWLTQDALWLVSKTVSDKLRAYLLTQGIDGIPTNNTALFNILQEYGIVQPTPDGKAIWKAAVTSDTGWEHSFTFLKLSPAAIWEGRDRPEAFAGTVQPGLGAVDTADSSPAMESAVIDETLPAESAGRDPFASQKDGDDLGGLLDLLEEIETQDDQAVEPAPDTAVSTETADSVSPAEPSNAPSGEHFMEWLRTGVRSRKLIINDAKALVHTVNGTAYLISPGIFQRYTQEHPQVAALAKAEQLSAWQWTQKRLEKLGLHRKQGNGLNIWICEVKGPRKSRRVHGYLLLHPETLFAEVPLNNVYLHLQSDAA